MSDDITKKVPHYTASDFESDLKELRAAAPDLYAKLPEVSMSQKIEISSVPTQTSFQVSLAEGLIARDRAHTAWRRVAHVSKERDGIYALEATLDDNVTRLSRAIEAEVKEFQLSVKCDRYDVCNVELVAQGVCARMDIQAMPHILPENTFAEFHVVSYAPTAAEAWANLWRRVEAVTGF